MFPCAIVKIVTMAKTEDDAVLCSVIYFIFYLNNGLYVNMYDFQEQYLVVAHGEKWNCLLAACSLLLLPVYSICSIKDKEKFPYRIKS